MFIKEIILDNFRVYYSNNAIQFEQDATKNIHLISGSNGYGKTTFLTSLIWCLYGKNMKDVEDVFKKEIDELGGYKKYVSSCMNKYSASEGKREFSVQVTFTDVNIPSVVCEDVTIKRKGYHKSGIDELEIYVDGHLNELTKEVGDELFIQDFILPREIAKFFFFDSEKIVGLAETKTIEEKRKLNRAYSEVLGIKKYVDLKKNLEDLRIRFRRDSAKKGDRTKFEQLSEVFEGLNNDLTEIQIKLDRANEDKLGFQVQSNELQENLIRKGSSLSIDDINNLRIDKYSYQKKIDELKNEFKEMLELAPFAMAFNLLLEVKDQVIKEQGVADTKEKNAILESKAAQISKALEKFTHRNLPTAELKEIRANMQNLVDEHLLPNKSGNKSFKTLHNFTTAEVRSLDSLVTQLKSSYATRLEQISKGLKDTKLKLGRISKKLSDAESKETDGVIKKYRSEKTIIDNKIVDLDNKLTSLNQEYGEVRARKLSTEKVVSELAKKIKVHEKFIAKDSISQELISNLDVFISRMKEQKKSSLEKRIVVGLKKLMHKETMIQDVRIELNDDLMDVILLDANAEEINKSTLSKGEQQLYATSLLKALVDESNIEFPVFIDSPLQKFDETHSSNIIQNFYPTISKQVVLFPLLNKEMTETEFNMLKPLVKTCFQMDNNGGIRSSLSKVPVNLLFNQNSHVQ